MCLYNKNNFEKGFSLVETLLAIGLVGGLALVLVQVNEISISSEEYERKANTITKLSRKINQILSDSTSCIANFRGLKVSSTTNIPSLGLSEDGTTASPDISSVSPDNRYGEDLDKKKQIIQIDKINFENFSPIFAPDYGVATLQVSLRGIKETRTLNKYFNIIVKVDSNNFITNCYTKSEAASEGLCNSLGGTMQFISGSWRCTDLNLNGTLNVAGNIIASETLGSSAFTENLTNSANLGASTAPFATVNVDDQLRAGGNINTTNLTSRLGTASGIVDSIPNLKFSLSLNGQLGQVHLTDKTCGNFSDPDITGGQAPMLLTGITTAGAPICKTYPVDPIIEYLPPSSGGSGGK